MTEFDNTPRSSESMNMAHQTRHRAAVRANSHGLSLMTRLGKPLESRLQSKCQRKTSSPPATAASTKGPDLNSERGEIICPQSCNSVHNPGPQRAYILEKKTDVNQPRKSYEEEEQDATKLLTRGLNTVSGPREGFLEEL